MQIDQQIQTYHNQYNKIDAIYSPALGDRVYFRYEGRMHLLYKNPRKYRTSSEILYKTSLFPFATPVIQHAQQISDIRSRGNINYYTLIHKVKPELPAIRVIVKKKGKGNYQFHSLMLNARRTKKSRRSETL